MLILISLAKEMEDPNGLIYNHQGKSFHAATSNRVSLFPEYRFCAVTRLSHFLQALRVLFPLRFFGKNISLESDKPHSKVQMIITAAMHIYFLCVFGNLVFYTLEIVMGFASVEPDPKLITLRNVIYNSRYGIMVIKSALLLLAFRWNSVDIYKISRQVSLEFEMAPEEMRITVAKVSILLLVVLALVSIGWEVMDFYSWETDFLSTWRKEVFLALTGEHVPMWKLWIPWYILATPMNFVMNVAMIFYASIILTIYLSWKKMNKDLWREKDYVWNKFEEDFERLRFSAEFVDDMLSVTVFVAWVCDIACAIGYVGSVVIYGAGSRTEQVYTLSGIFIHAVWSPACYLVPCILYQEQVSRSLKRTAAIVF